MDTYIVKLYAPTIRKERWWCSTYVVPAMSAQGAIGIIKKNPLINLAEAKVVQTKCLPGLNAVQLCESEVVSADTVPLESNVRLDL